MLAIMQIQPWTVSRHMRYNQQVLTSIRSYLSVSSMAVLLLIHVAISSTLQRQLQIILLYFARLLLNTITYLINVNIT